MNLVYFKIQQYLNFLFVQQTGGVYLDFGAGSGGAESVSHLLYKDLGWRGLCSEKNKLLFEALQQQRDDLSLLGHLSLDQMAGPMSISAENLSEDLIHSFTMAAIQSLIVEQVDFCNLQQYDLELIVCDRQFFQMNISVVSILNIQQLHLIYKTFKVNGYNYINRIGGFDFFLKNTEL